VKAWQHGQQQKKTEECIAKRHGSKVLWSLANRLLLIGNRRKSVAKTFEVEIKFEDREKGSGTVAGKAIVTAGTMAAAIGKGVREILDKTDRKQNFDMQKHGVEILVRSTAEAGEEERSDEAESAAGA
jgi:predicted Zn-dependent protease